MHGSPDPPHAYPNKPAVAVGAVVFTDDAVLLVKRRQPPNQGIWAIPGGSIELGETLQQAAEREIMEETGVRIRAGEPVFVFDVVDRDEDGRIRYHYVIVDILGEYLEGKPIASDDALEARWIRADELPSLQVSAVTLELLAELNFGADS